ncbi:MAG: hypothetical protein KAV45_08955 [Calditrichia bacterium]|nr:hypothetical protein [Calditrichia bacterium]
MDNQRIMAAGFVGGLVAGALNSIPILNFINCFCCAGIMLGGAVALIYYDRSFTVREYINPATAVTVGITAGLFGAFISLGIDYLIYINFGHWELDFMYDVLEAIEEVPPVIEEMLYELEQDLQAGFIWGSLLFRNLILMPIFCLIGAMITRVYINKNREESI